MQGCLKGRSSIRIIGERREFEGIIGNNERGGAKKRTNAFINNEGQTRYRGGEATALTTLYS